jgi:UDP-2-acetamido-3-amino-2,3-dideoxy-glucuronate N-acetyltransferase
MMVGVPARQIGWMSQYGEKLDLPLKGNAQTTCENTGQKYQLKDSVIKIIK